MRDERPDDGAEPGAVVGQAEISKHPSHVGFHQIEDVPQLGAQPAERARYRMSHATNITALLYLIRGAKLATARLSAVSRIRDGMAGVSRLERTGEQAPERAGRVPSADGPGPCGAGRQSRTASRKSMQRISRLMVAGSTPTGR